MVRNQFVNSWIKKMEGLLCPEEIVWITGSREQMTLLYNIACGTKELIKLNEDKLPGCYLHRSNEFDVSRVEDRTFICCNNKIDAGFTNNWWNPSDSIEKLNSIAEKSYEGRIMYVIPFSMGRLDSDFHKLGIQITDSIYVAISMTIMARVSRDVEKQLNVAEDNWTKCIHCSCSCDPENRYICHFPEKNMIVSVNSSYGGNALLGKKCLSLRLGSYMGKKEGWLAEHMAIFGVKSPNKDIKYFCAALPSGCGKTDLAMLDPDDSFKKLGYEIFCVGDDIAWLKIGKDGRLWAINPENGVFGACSGVNDNNNKNAFRTGLKNTIFTNVVHNLEDNTVWWEGMNDNPPDNADDWLGEPWDSSCDHSGAHPNSRFAAPLSNCPCLSSESENPNGVPISAILLGVKRPKLTPLVFEANDWNHGVFLGSIMSSESTVAHSGKIGVLRHDPFGMLPFCGYNMSDYFQHWINIGSYLGKNAPKIFGINWFRTDDSGKFIWPGFNHNIRILDWIFKRCDNMIGCVDSPIGKLPMVKDIDISELDISQSDLNSILSVDSHVWKSEISEIESFYSKFDKPIPDSLIENFNRLKNKIL